MNFDFNIFKGIIFQIIPYIKVTLFIAISALIIALVLAIILAVINEYKIPIFRNVVNIYVSFFRSTPMLSQLFFFYFAVSPSVSFLNDIEPIVALIIVMSMNESAFMSETIRGALSSVDKGQREAGLSIGMTELQVMRRIVIPQAFRVALPGLSNSFISLIKGSSLGFTIGVIELLTEAKLISARNFRVMEAYMAALVVYWVVIALLTKCQRILEQRINKSIGS